MADVVAPAVACGGASPYLTQAACADPNVSALSAAMSDTIKVIAQPLSRRGRELLLDGHGQWLTAMRTTCDLKAEDTELSFAQSLCVQISMVDRTVGLPILVQRAGPHTIQQVETFRALPAPQTSEDKIAMLSAAFYPRIDNPGENEAAFNAAAVRTIKPDLPSDTEQTIINRIIFANAQIISVEYDILFSTRGAAHQDRNVEALTYLVDKRRALRADDLFDTRANWKEPFAKLSAEQLKVATIQEGCDAPLALEEARDASLRADRWLISTDGLIVLYPPYALGPYSMEGCQIVLPWAALKPLLRKDAPIPSKPEAREPKTLEG
jgi:hypothetical protein